MITDANLKTDLPPFTLGNGNPADIGRNMADAYAMIEAKNISMRDIVAASATALGLDESSKFVAAGLKLAKAIDEGQGNGLEGGYHNAQHFKEVVMNTTQLALRNNAGRNDGIILDAGDKGKLLFSAIAHDFNYERGGNVTPSVDPGGKPTPAPYRLEDISFTSARPYLEAEGVSKSDIADIGVAIYGTDVSPASQAGKFVREANYYLFEGAQKPVPSEVQSKVAPILEDKKLARFAAILSDADIFSSAGTTLDYNLVQSKKIEAETVVVKATPGSSKFFVENIVGGRFTTPAGQFFQPNLDTLVADYTAKLAAATPAPVQAAVVEAKPAEAAIVPAYLQGKQGESWVVAAASDGLIKHDDARRRVEKWADESVAKLKETIDSGIGIIASNRQETPPQTVRHHAAPSGPSKLAPSVKK